MENFMKNVTSFNDHPLIAHKVTHLCDINTGSKEFCEIVDELTMLMGYEVLKDLKTKNIRIQAPIADFDSPVLAEDFTIVPILRAGLGMVEGLRRLSPTARVGHIGLARDPETLNPVTYYYKMPVDIKHGPVIIVDPALATGGSLDAAIEYIQKEGCTDIKVMCIFASDVGLERLCKKYPDVKIYAAKYIPGGLNKDGYIVYAAGDAGDRIYGTCSYKRARQAKP